VIFLTYNIKLGHKPLT